jgi:hypothetical protein
MSNPTESHNGFRPTAGQDGAEQFERQRADYLWALGEPAITDRYPGKVVVLHQRTVLGSGRDDLEALADARQGAAGGGRPLPDVWELLFVPVPERAWFPPESSPSKPAPSNG